MNLDERKRILDARAHLAHWHLAKVRKLEAELDRARAEYANAEQARQESERDYLEAVAPRRDIFTACVRDAQRAQAGGS